MLGMTVGGRFGEAMDGVRELVIHTGLDPSLVDELVAETSCNQAQLRQQGIRLHPSQSIVAAVLHNDWTLWRRRERLQRLKPWRRHDHLWAVAPGLVHGLLQERRLRRLQQQVSALGFHLAVVVHLLDGREQLARDYARALMSLRFRGTFDDFVERQLHHHQERYRVDRLFEPLLESLGARGLRFVRHSAAPGERLSTTWATLEILGGAASRPRAGTSAKAPPSPPAWSRPDGSPALLSMRKLNLARGLLQSLPTLPRGPQRAQLRKTLDARLAENPGPDAIVESWAEVLGSMEPPPILDQAQERLGYKAWGLGWPDTTSSAALEQALKTSARQSRQALRRSRRRSG